MVGKTTKKVQTLKSQCKMEHSSVSLSPHVVVLPFPGQGHIKPMFNLAKLLCHAGFTITFINSHSKHAQLQRFIDLDSFHLQFPHLYFISITDGLPTDHPRSGPTVYDVFSPTSRSLAALGFREMFLSICREKGRWLPPSCIIADGIMSSCAVDVAQEFHVPLITFRTDSATCTWVYLHISKLIDEGVIPVPQQDEMDKVITSIPGLENLLRHRDLPSICRLNPGNTFLDFFIKETSAMTRASALILNTFDELESPIVSKLATIFPKIYTMPLSPLCNTLINPSSNNVNYGRLREEDRSCLTWLNSQKPNTVLYISFGTVVVLSRDQLLEFWYGLVNSGIKFLWVIRRGLIDGEEDPGRNNPVELETGTKERGFLVDWAPQEEVLAHPAIGGFMTHSGWNSTLEGIIEGVPMICWPLMIDQMVNSRFVSEKWRVGVDMKDTCDRITVEKMVRDVMENKREEFLRSTAEIARKARESVNENGSSYANLEKLIQDIRSMSNIDECCQYKVSHQNNKGERI